MTNTLARPLRPRAAYRKHSANKPGVLPDEKLESYKASVAREVGKTARSTEPVSEVLNRFYARYLCPACGSPAACQHRDRKLDVRLILRRIA